MDGVAAHLAWAGLKGEGMYQDIIRFWFKEISSDMWWASDPAFDELIRSRFGATLRGAAQGELCEWRDAPHGRLAEVIVLDQFSRNVWRNTPLAFAQDPMALALAQEAVRQGVHATLTATEATFLLMPYMHSESRAIHVQADALFKAFAPPYNHDFELKHKAIVDRFGRYPHRNAILGRASTEEELLFLRQPGSSF
jgi:uncharacterized protein (DUF924 family)